MELSSLEKCVSIEEELEKQKAWVTCLQARVDLKNITSEIYNKRNLLITLQNDLDAHDIAQLEASRKTLEGMTAAQKAVVNRKKFLNHADPKNDRDAIKKEKTMIDLMRDDLELRQLNLQLLKLDAQIKQRLCDTKGLPEKIEAGQIELRILEKYEEKLKTKVEAVTKDWKDRWNTTENCRREPILRQKIEEGEKRIEALISNIKDAHVGKLEAEKTANSEKKALTDEIASLRKEIDQLKTKPGPSRAKIILSEDHNISVSKKRKVL